MSDMQQRLDLGMPAPAKAREIPADSSALELMRALAESAREKLESGTRSPSREEIKAIEKLAILERGETHWPDRPSIARELGVNDKSIERYKAEGAPIESHAPTEKIPVYRWLLDVARQEGGKVGQDSDVRAQLEVEELRTKRLKNDRMEGRMIEEAAINARTAMVNIFRALKQSLLHEASVRIADQVGNAANRHDREQLTRGIIRDILNEHAEQAGAMDDDDLPEKGINS